MTILRSDLDTGRVDFSDIDTGERIPPTTPGEVLRDDWMEPNGLTQYALAKALKVPAIRMSQILHGKRAITADTAMRLARFFGNTPRYWMALQADYELQRVEDELGGAIAEEVQPLGERAA